MLIYSLCEVMCFFVAMESMQHIREMRAGIEEKVRGVVRACASEGLRTEVGGWTGS